MPLNKSLDSIEESDLQELIDNQVPEGKSIEYKEALPGNADGDKSETTTERIRNFRADRLSMIVAEEGAISLDENAPKIVLHLVPFEAFDPAAKFDLFLLVHFHPTF